MELKLSNVLHAEVKASVSPSNLDIYGFTLYHGYKVKSVKDESGRDLKFRQNDDWIEVESAGRDFVAYIHLQRIFKYSLQQRTGAHLCREHLRTIPVPGMSLVTVIPDMKR